MEPADNQAAPAEGGRGHADGPFDLGMAHAARGQMIGHPREEGRPRAVRPEPVVIADRAAAADTEDGCWRYTATGTSDTITG